MSYETTELLGSSFAWTRSAFLRVAIAAIAGVAVTASAALGFTLDNFQCNSSSTVINEPPIPDASLLDFSSYTANVSPVGALCAPTNNNGSDSTAPTHPDYLLSYGLTVRNRKLIRPRLPQRVRVTNAYGTQDLQVLWPMRLLVPSVQSLSGPPSGSVSPDLDHFTCYGAKTPKGSPRFTAVRNVTLQDEFGTVTVNIKRPAYFCTPVSANGGGVPDESASLVCYRMTRKLLQPPVGAVFVNNEMGPGSVYPNSRDFLCVPSSTTTVTGCGYPYVPVYVGVPLLGPLTTSVASVDWVTQGVVTPPKTRGACDSDWAFAATAVMESSYAIETGVLNSLSEQQLVDCDHANLACGGGNVVDAINYANAQGGLCSESEYPYTAVDGTCRANTCGTFYNPGILVRGRVPGGDEVSLQAYVAEAPVSAVIVGGPWLESYTGGIANPACDPCSPGAAYTDIAIVGYGTDGGVPYWKLKVARGSSFGESGYVRLRRGVDACGIADFAALLVE